jgi:hypothetical protein
MDADEIAKIRSIPLSTVLEVLGAKRDPNDPSRNWRLGSSRITVTDSRFYDHNEAGALHRMKEGRAGGGGAIDLVQYLKNVNFREAVRELSGLAASRRQWLETPVKLPSPAVAIRDDRPAPVPASDRTGRARWYLTTVRAIPERIVDRALESGDVFSDTRGNVVFRLKNETGREVGFEVRGTFERPYHSVHGEKGLYITKADSTLTVAFVESGIEALSYQALKGTGLIISTTGNAVELPGRIANALKARGYGIVAAFNADKAGDRMSAILAERLKGDVRRDRPTDSGKDWNDQLQNQRARKPHPPGATGTARPEPDVRSARTVTGGALER